MENIVLPVQEREIGAKNAKSLREGKQIPLVVYGHGVDNKHLSADAEAFRKTFKKAGRNTIVTIQFENGKDEKVLIHDVDLHPVSGAALHADLYVVQLKEKITTTIPLEFTGVSHAVKNLGGIFVESMSEVEVKCLPTDLVHEISVDITSMEHYGDTLHVSDIIAPKGIEILNDGEETLAVIQAPKEEVVSNEAPSADQLVPESAKDTAKAA